MDGHPNYTEDDVKEARPRLHGLDGRQTPSRAIPTADICRSFVYIPEDHDDGEKTFLGETGNWNGEDIINIIVKQPAAARFISRHLYNFFVADDVAGPGVADIRRPVILEADQELEAEYFRSNYDIRSMLRLLFNSDFFKNARFAKVKSPVEAVVGTMRLVGEFTIPQPGCMADRREMRYMGQDLAEPAHRRGLAYRQGVDR